MRVWFASNQQSTESRSVWERWLPSSQLAFVVLVTVAAGLTFTDTSADSAYFPLIAFLTIGILGWYRLPFNHRINSFQHPPQVVIYFALGWGLWFALTALSPAFFLLLFVLFPHVFMLIEVPYSIGATAVLNGLVLIHLNRINSEFVSTWMLLVIFTFIGGSLLAYFITDIIRQSEERRRLITMLEATRDDLAKAQHAAGVLTERQRLAGELHDTIAQGLIAVILQLENAESGDLPPVSLAHIRQAKALARENLNEARRLIWEMRPTVLEQHSFDDGLKYVVESWAVSNRIPADLTITGERQPLPHTIELAILRVIQEALANVAKHAHAAHVTVTLSYMSDEVLVDVCDDGKGFDHAAINAHSFGLTNMRRRVEQMRGQLTIETASGEGTTLAAAFPLTPKLEAAS